MKVSPIICAVCKRPVERVVTIESNCDLTVTFRVFCHGETEEATLGAFDFKLASKIEGIAFASKKLAAQSPLLTE